MNINYRGPDWPPIYFDPDHDEMVALTKTFDTLRIGLLRERDGYHLVIASGYGSTHSTLSRALGELNPRCKPSRRDGLKYNGLDGTAILYEDGGRFWFNMCDYGGLEKVSVDDALPIFPQPVRRMLQEIVTLAIEQQFNRTS